MTTFNYLIVGAGPAGCVLANRLSADRNVNVALIEAGPDRNARKAIVKTPLAMVTFMAPALAFLGGPKFVSWFESEPEPGLQGRRLALPRGRGTGGCSNINGQIYIRGQREDFDHWRDLGNADWGYDDLLPYFKKIERFELLVDPKANRHAKLGGKPLAEQIDPRFHGVDGPLNLAPLRSFNPLADVYFEAAQLAGHELNPDFNGERQSGVGPWSFTHVGGERMTAERAYLDPVRDRPNLSIFSDRQVTRVIVEGKRAVGVAFSGPSGADEIRAGEVILSAGSFVSPHILMLSGIGAAKDLSRLGIPVVHDLPGVGENLQDHVDVTLEFRSKNAVPYGLSWKALPRNALHVLDWIFRRRGLFASTTADGGGFVSTVPGVDRPDIQLFFCSALGNTQNASGAGHGFLLHVCQLRPGSIGRLTLKTADPSDKPSILYNFFLGESTMRALREGIRIARKIVAQKPFAPHLKAETSPGPEAQSDGALDAFIRETVGTLFHPVGTCRMGRGPDDVVDPASLRVHGVEGLRVIDASIMPTVVSGNTLAATYCIAEKGADLILRGDRGAAEPA